MRILHVDINHPLILDQFAANGWTNDTDYTSSKEEIESQIHLFDGVVIRSRFSIDKAFLDKATNLKFIGRLGAGLENIDTKYATKKGVFLASAPEGNRNAVAEHALGMLLSLFNKLTHADNEIRNGKWDREGNRGIELDGKTIGIIGYGNMGKAFAKKLRGFDVEVLCYDVLENVGDKNAKQVDLSVLQQKSDVVSLHVPQTESTTGMVNSDFINAFQKPFWLLNTARGKCVNTIDLVAALELGKILGAGLDVLEYEKSSFENMFTDDKMPESFQYLIQSKKVLLSPHVAGWTIESKEKLAQTVVNKVLQKFL